MTPFSVSRILRPLSFAGLLATVWLVAAAFRPALTFHLAPVLIAGSVPLLVTAEDVATPRHVALSALTGFALAIGTAGVISVATWMRGPSLLPFGGPAVEALVFAAGGALLGALVAVMKPRPPATSAHRR